MPKYGGFCPKEQLIRVQLHSTTSKSKPQALSHLLAVHSCSLPYDSWAIPAKKAGKKAGSCCCSQFSGSFECPVRDAGGGKNPAPLTQPAPSIPHTHRRHARSISITVRPRFCGLASHSAPFPIAQGTQLPCRSSLIHWKLKKSTREWTDGSWAKTCLKDSAAFLLLHSCSLLRKITDQQLKQPSSACAVGTIYT